MTRPTRNPHSTPTLERIATRGPSAGRRLRDGLVRGAGRVALLGMALFLLAPAGHT